MEVLQGVVKDGRIVLHPAVDLPEGASVCIIVEDSDKDRAEPYEREPLSEASVLADIAWAARKKQSS